MEETAEWSPLKWEQLRVVGKPLLSVAAFGATPLLWAACRAQPCLVHIFCDTQLQEIWRFPADPVFLLIGSGSRLEGEGGRTECNARLVVITRDGCIWAVQLWKTSNSTRRLSKRQKTQNVGEIQRIKPALAKTTIARATSAAPPVQSQRQGPPGDAIAKSPFLTCWKEVAVETYTAAARANEVKNVSVVDTLLGTIPGATVAAFGPNGYVAIASQAGSPELLHFNRLAATSILGHSEGPDFRSCAPVFRGEPTCLLVVTSVRHSQTSGPREGQAVISQDLLESLLDPSAGISDCKSLLIQGGMDGKVYTFHLQEGKSAVPSPHVVFDFHQPLVAIIPVDYPPPTTRGRCSRISTTQECNEASGPNCLIVVGLLGQVAFLSSVKDQTTLEELDDFPFLARHTHTPVGDESKCRPSSTLMTLVSTEGIVSGPITSACLVDGARLCFNAGSTVFITDNLGSFMKGGGGMGDAVQDPRSSSSSISILPSQRVPASNIVNIGGPGLFTYKGSHPLVVLTRAGSLLSIKVFKQITSPVSAINPGADTHQNAPNACSGKSVEELLQSIADAESCRDVIQSHEQALVLAMNELALALPRARDIATDKKNLGFKSGIRNNILTSNEESAPANAGLSCTLTATPAPSNSLVGDQLSFGGIGSGSLRKPSRFAAKNMYHSFKTRLDITLINRTRNPLSQYWSLILELQSCLSTVNPTFQCSFTINNGHGLPVGSQWEHRIHVNLPGGPWGPVMATVYLCHIHDSHKALLQNFRSSDRGRNGHKLERVSNAACVVLLRQQVDLFSLLQTQQSTLGHTSWTPTLRGSGNLRTRMPSLAGTREIEMLDLADLEMLGSFSGDVAWSSRLDGITTSRTINSAVDWQKVFLSHVLQQPSAASERTRLRLVSQGGGTVSVLIDRRAAQESGSQSVVNIQTSCLQLGVLFREALLCQIMELESEALGGIRKDGILHRNKSRDFTGMLKEVQALAHRGREALNLWIKFQGLRAAAAEDLLMPLLDHTYGITGQLIQAYKTHREESSFTPP